jgi:dihydropyrimidine dehydrogenase (NADP+)
VADLSITVNGMKFENPFVLGVGPARHQRQGHRPLVRPGLGRHGRKTFSLDASKVINTAPRYAKVRAKRARTRSSASRTSS